jgi:hypothetical protein
MAKPCGYVSRMASRTGRLSAEEDVREIEDVLRAYHLSRSPALQIESQER